jgi:HAD superfamily hydrolase (TIGR01459 family)
MITNKNLPFPLLWLLSGMKTLSQVQGFRMVQQQQPVTAARAHRGCQTNARRHSHQPQSADNNNSNMSVVPSSKSSMRLVQGGGGGIREIVDCYDVFLLDMWGVLHDGTRPYDGVLETIQRLKAANKRLIVLSNSSKRKSNSVKMLTKLGFDATDFEQIITSGEVAHQLLSGEAAFEWGPLTEEKENKKVVILGSGDDDLEYCESCGWTASSVEEASLVIARGTFTINDGSQVVHKKKDPDEYERVLAERLRQAAARRLPMLVANPDKVRPDKNRPPMPGQIGDQYELALVAAGEKHPESLVKRIGKPFADVYQMALQHTPNLSRVCMVGDALETDVVGGSAFGVDTVWVVKDGIHSDDIDRNDLWNSASAVLESFNEKSGTYADGRKLSPTILMPHFQW